VLFAFQSEAVRNKWLEFLDEARIAYDKALWLDRVDQARTQGFAMAASSVVRGVTDISAPILQDGSAVGALTVPFVERQGQHMDAKESLLQICEAAGRISDALKLGGATAPARKEESGAKVRSKAQQ
jgi:DNA-binding IclR family transcriptional regulator